ncbi:MAG: AAA family ATPase, partial [Thermotoga sp.]
KKTYRTKGLKNIVEIAKARLEGRSGDSAIQLQTPFGGGKTHTLIALFHKAKEWNAKVVVFDGSAPDAKEIKPWEELEKQLTGKIEITRGNLSPGKEKIIRILSENSPVLILMDEVLEYMTKASVIKVGDSNLASQTLAFIQELTASVSTVGNSLLVLTLPSSILEHYDENAERMFQQLQKVIGRVERVYTPVEDEEIEYVVRARLFSKVDERGVREVVDDFIEYAKNEGLISGDEAVYYRERFLSSYPFKPEVIDILYKRWGSFPTFQRTRAVLRLLSLVVHSLLDKNIPFIRLGDFDLSNDEVRRELIKYVGQEWDAIIAQDITSSDSGAKKIDDGIGSSYKPYKLGTVVSTTIFMMSFPDGARKECSVRKIKLSTVHPELPSNVIDTVIADLREKLFYISDDGLFFTNQPNLNRIIISREESVTSNDIYEEEKRMIERHISRSSKFRIYIQPKFSKDIPDTPELKLVILDGKPDEEFLERYGENPRVYRNTLIFLCADESQKGRFQMYLRRYLALKSISEDNKLKLTEGQRREVKSKLKNHERKEYEELRRYYRRLFLPAKDGYKEMYMGLPNFGESFLDGEIYGYLKSQSEILERISPRVIRDKYMLDKDYVEIKKLYEAFLKTPGEIRLVSKEGFLEGIIEGVKNGLFGFGYIGDEGLECKCINETPSIGLTDGEIILKSELCMEQEKIEVERTIRIPKKEKRSTISTLNETKSAVEEKKYSKLGLKLKVPTGQISTIARIISYLRGKFSRFSIEISIHAYDGEISISEYENKVMEALMQDGIEIEKEENEGS